MYVCKRMNVFAPTLEAAATTVFMFSLLAWPFCITYWVKARDLVRFCSPDKGVFYAYAYIIYIYSTRIYSIMYVYKLMKVFAHTLEAAATTVFMFSLLALPHGCLLYYIPG
jgi:hypothetical protein